MKLGQKIRMIKGSRFYNKGQEATIAELWKNNDGLAHIPNKKGSGFRIIHIKQENEGVLWVKTS